MLRKLFSPSLCKKCFATCNVTKKHTVVIVTLSKISLIFELAHRGKRWVQQKELERKKKLLFKTLLILQIAKWTKYLVRRTWNFHKLNRIIWLNFLYEIGKNICNAGGRSLINNIKCKCIARFDIFVLFYLYVCGLLLIRFSKFQYAIEMQKWMNLFEYICFVFFYYSLKFTCNNRRAAFICQSDKHTENFFLKRNHFVSIKYNWIVKQMLKTLATNVAHLAKVNFI